MTNTTKKVNISEMRTTIATTTSTRTIMKTREIGIVHTSLIKMGNLFLGEGEYPRRDGGRMSCVEDKLKKMLRRFDAID